MSGRNAAVLAAVLVAVGASAAGGAQALAVFVNGVKTSDFLVSGGKVYVSTDALAKAGAEVTRRPDGLSVQFIPVGGRMQVDAVEGVMGEWISNGTWRVRVSEVAAVNNPFGPGPGFSVRLEMRNLTKGSLSAHGSGLDKVQLIDSEGNVLSVSDSSFKDRYVTVPPAGGFVNVLRFGDPRNTIQKAGQPAKLMLLFRGVGGKRALPHVRIALKAE